MKKDIIMSDIESIETIAGKIHPIRGMKVMLDADLAELYGVATKALNQAVTRNEQRFPPDFMFRLAKEEKQELVTNCDRLNRLKHSSALPPQRHEMARRTGGFSDLVLIGIINDNKVT